MTEITALYNRFLQPSEDLLADFAKLDGDIMILGVGGKMGPALARLARQSADLVGRRLKVIGVSRFSEPGLRHSLQQLGIETHAVDLLHEEQLHSLPDAKYILYLAGTKFGTTGKEPFTWAMNAYLPGRIAEKYKRSNIVVFSTGNVYPFTAVDAGGAKEDQLPEPMGEYAQSCLGRERVFQYFSSINNTPLFIYRLNYANDVSYGVLLEIANSVREKKPIDLRMGYVNVIWQGEANEIAIRALRHCSVPPATINVTGPETISIRWLAEQFGTIFGQKPLFMFEEEKTALLSNAARSFSIFGYPKVLLNQMIGLIAEWVIQGGKMIDKPTHFQERQGKF